MPRWTVDSPQLTDGSVIASGLRTDTSLFARVVDDEEDVEAAS